MIRTGFCVIHTLLDPPSVPDKFRGPAPTSFSRAFNRSIQTSCDPSPWPLPLEHRASVIGPPSESAKSKLAILAAKLTSLFVLVLCVLQAFEQMLLLPPLRNGMCRRQASSAELRYQSVNAGRSDPQMQCQERRGQPDRPRTADVTTRRVSSTIQSFTHGSRVLKAYSQERRLR
jgi:hypothetical protein